MSIFAAGYEETQYQSEAPGVPDMAGVGLQSLEIRVDRDR